MPEVKAKTLARMIDSLAERSDASMMIRLQQDSHEVHSYEELAGNCLGLARGLVQAKKGEKRIALFAETGYQAVAAALGIMRSNRSVVLLDVQLDDGLLADIFADSGCRTVFTSSRQQRRLREIDPELDLFLLDGEEGSWKRLLADDGALPEIGSDDEAALFYTSGTTGPPKGVPLTHANLAFQLEAVAATRLVEQGATVLQPLPLHHVYPFVIGILVPLSLGLAIVVPASLTGPQILRALQEGEVSVVIGVPKLYQAMLKGIRSRFAAKGRLAARAFDTVLGLSMKLQGKGLAIGRIIFAPLRRRLGAYLDILASGGSPLDPELGRRLEVLGWRVAVGYGLTETSPLLTINLPDSSNLQSIGKPIDGVELQFDSQALPEDDEGADSKSEHGELLARGPGVFSGYLNLEEKTREALEDGWYRTGDLGWRDEEGFVYLSGRASTLIVTEGGENVQPDRIEDVLADHPMIREAGVLEREGGLAALLVYDPKHMEEGEGESLRDRLGQALREQMRNRPSYEGIGDFRITREALPRTRLGKIKRHLLEERYDKAGEEGEGRKETGPLPVEEMNADDRSLLQNDNVEKVWELLASEYPERGLSPDSHFELDLGVDSLEWLNLTMSIRRQTGIEIDDETIADLEVVRDLLTAVAEGEPGGDQEDVLEKPEEALSEDQKKYLQPPGSFGRRAATTLAAVNLLALRGYFSLQVEGEENIPGERIVFAPNHASYLDPFALAAALKRDRLENTYWVGLRAAAFHNPVNAAISRLAKTIPMDPRKGVTSALAAAAAVLDRDKNLVWFAEGGRSPDGELQPLQMGIGVLLERRDTQVLPVYIKGTHRAMPVGKVFPKPAKVEVIFGKPVQPDELESEGEGETAQQRITTGLQMRLAELQQRYE